jgi:hypothetical protein
MFIIDSNDNINSTDPGLDSNIKGNSLNWKYSSPPVRGKHFFKIFLFKYFVLGII